MRIKLTIEIEVDEEYYSFNEEGRLWLENEILVGDGNLLLYSRDIGDEVGDIKKVTNVTYLFGECKTT